MLIPGSLLKEVKMKKIIIATVALMTSLAFAGSITLEGQDQLGDKGAKNSVNESISVKESINKTFAADALGRAVSCWKRSACGSSDPGPATPPWPRSSALPRPR